MSEEEDYMEENNGGEETQDRDEYDSGDSQDEDTGDLVQEQEEESPTPVTHKPGRKKAGKKAKVKVKKVKKAKPAKKKKAAGPVGSRRSKFGAQKGDGIVATILETFQRPDGATVQETFDVLKKKFKDKGDSMLTTIRIQSCSLGKRFGFEMKKTRVEGRGLVYKAPKSVKYVVQKTGRKPAGKKAVGKKAA